MIENLKPLAAYAFMKQNPSYLLIDVRSTMEFLNVGRAQNSISIPWQEFHPPGIWRKNPRFSSTIQEKLKNHSDGDQDYSKIPILLICRSGSRSFEAALELENSGLQNLLINIQEGFSGVDSKLKSGWRANNLPCEAEIENSKQ